jgi:hypothetical protein
MVICGAEAAGRAKGKDGFLNYLTSAAKKHVPNYLSLLGRVYPQPQQQPETQVPPEQRVYRTQAEIINDMIKRGMNSEMLYGLAMKVAAVENGTNQSDGPAAELDPPREVE